MSKIKNLRIVIAIIAIAILGTTVSQAAFPVAKEKERTEISSSSSNTNYTTDENVVKTADESATAKASPAPAHKPGGSGKSQIIALLLCFFLGGIGIHRFYLGYTWQGVVQLLTAGGCGIWALIDFIRIITGDLGPKDGKYSKTF